MKSLLGNRFLLSCFCFVQFCVATELVIPDGTKKIGDRAFDGRKDITSVTIPGSVTEIGLSAFRECTSLTSVTIPGSVTEIGCSAFSGCTSLTSVTIPGSVTEIGGLAFKGCTSLTSVTIPGSVTEIGSDAFNKCTSLTSITIPDGVKKIGYRAFYSCRSLASVVIPGSVTEIGWSAFEECTSLTSITIPDGVKKIGNHAFYNCRSLASVVIPGSVTEIGIYNAFEGCRLDRDELCSRWKEARIAAEEARIAAEEARIPQLKEKLNIPGFSYPYDSLCDSHVPIFRDYSSGMSEESIQARLSLAKIQFESISRNTIHAQDLNQTITALGGKNTVYLSAIKFEYISGQSCLLLFGHLAPDSLNGALIGAIWNVPQQTEEEVLLKKFKNEFSGGTLSKKYNPQKTLAGNQLKQGLAMIGYESGQYIDPDDVKFGTTSYTFKLGNRTLVLTTPIVLNLDAIEDGEIKQTVSAYFNSIMSLNSSNVYSICCFDAKWVEICSKLCVENEKNLKEKRMNESMQNLGF